jgi:hypothetical protein
MLDKYRKTRNKRRRVGSKKQRASKRSHRFLTRRRRTHKKQRGGAYGDFGASIIPDSALVDYISKEDDGHYAPRTVTYARHGELLEESERA